MASNKKQQRLTAQKIVTTNEEHPFTEEPGITDFAVVVEGKKLFVHKGVLAVVSPVFKKMFISDFKEKRLKELVLPEKSFEDVVEFLKFVYPNQPNQKPLNINTVIQVLPLVHEYGCEYPLEQCQRFLVEHIQSKGRYLDIEILLMCLWQSEMYDLKEAYKVCLEEGSKYSLSSLRSSKLFAKLPIEIRERLYEFRVAHLERAGEGLIKTTYDSYHQRVEFECLGLLLDKNIVITDSLFQVEYNPCEKYKLK